MKFWLGTMVTYVMIQPLITEVQGCLKWPSVLHLTVAETVGRLSHYFGQIMRLKPHFRTVPPQKALVNSDMKLHFLLIKELVLTLKRL